VKLVAADLTLPEATLAVVEQHEIVFNLAHDFAARTDDNVRSLELLANACRRSGVARLVQVSSIAVYDGWPRTDLNEGSPATMTGHPYKKAKLRIEGALRTLGKSGEFTTVILQPTIVYGPFSKLWTDDIADRMAATPAIIPSESLGLCNGVYVDDVVDALLAAATAPVAPGESFIISGPAPFPWRELFESYARALNQSLVLEKSSPASISGSPAKFHQRFKAYVIRHARSFIATEVSPAARRLLGNRRFEDLMAKVRIAVISRQGIYRPASSNPALYYSRAQCSIEKARRLLVPPGISAHEGLELTASYLRWRQGASARR
jgi:nucleoside-diphosphate-sugar epimerase